MESVRLLDIDETDPSDTTDVLFEFEFFGGGASGPFSVADLHGFDLSNTTNLSSIDLTGNNSFFQYGFRGAPGADADGRVRHVSAFIVTYDDISGAVGGITYDRPSEVPLPAGLPLLLSGLAALGVAARRRRG